MKKDNEKTKVAFKLEYNEYTKQFDILAVFVNDIQRDNSISCYSHIEQHSSCCQHYFQKLRNASKNNKNVKNLINELENLFGYNLEVVYPKHARTQ